MMKQSNNSIGRFFPIFVIISLCFLSTKSVVVVVDAFVSPQSYFESASTKKIRPINDGRNTCNRRVDTVTSPPTIQQQRNFLTTTTTTTKSKTNTVIAQAASVVGGEQQTSQGDDNYNIDEMNSNPMDACINGYYLDTANQVCKRLGPLGIISQVVERLGPFKRVANNISSLFGIDHERMSKLGVAFALSYSAISNINGAISLSVSWYIACTRTGLSPLAPGNWKELVRAYATIYAIIQLLRPFRVAAAIGMSKLSSELLDITQEKLNCSKKSAIAIQFSLGLGVWISLAFIGVLIASSCSGVPIWGGW